MALTTRDIASMWKSGKPGKAAGTSTDGANIFSYELKIGYTDAEGNKVALDYRGPNRYSNTTTRHVTNAVMVADRIEVPT